MASYCLLVTIRLITTKGHLPCQRIFKSGHCQRLVVVDLRKGCGHSPGVYEIKVAASLDLLQSVSCPQVSGTPMRRERRTRTFPSKAKTTPWHDGFDRYDYLMDEESFAIMPFKRPGHREVCGGQSAERAAPLHRGGAKENRSDNPWSWQACYWDHEPRAEVELLRRGFSHRLHHA